MAMKAVRETTIWNLSASGVPSDKNVLVMYSSDDKRYSASDSLLVKLCRAANSSILTEVSTCLVAFAKKSGGRWPGLPRALRGFAAVVGPLLWFPIL